MEEKNSYSDLSYFEMYEEFKRLQQEMETADPETADPETKEFLKPYYIEAQRIMLKWSVMAAKMLNQK